MITLFCCASVCASLLTGLQEPAAPPVVGTWLSAGAVLKRIAEDDSAPLIPPGPVALPLEVDLASGGPSISSKRAALSLKWTEQLLPQWTKELSGKGHRVLLHVSLCRAGAAYMAGAHEDELEQSRGTALTGSRGLMVISPYRMERRLETLQRWIAGSMVPWPQVMVSFAMPVRPYMAHSELTREKVLEAVGVDPFDLDALGDVHTVEDAKRLPGGTGSYVLDAIDWVDKAYTDAVVQSIRSLTGGHPFLIRAEAAYLGSDPLPRGGHFGRTLQIIERTKPLGLVVWLDRNAAYASQADSDLLQAGSLTAEHLVCGWMSGGAKPDLAWLQRSFPASYGTILKSGILMHREAISGKQGGA